MSFTRATLLMFWAWAAPLSASAQTLPSTAFFYGQDVPRELATVYDQIVVQPEHAGDPARIAQLGAAPVAYFSVGELAPSQARGLPAGWTLAQNDAWSSLVMDLTNAAYRAHVLERFESLWQRGYRRFFLDTLDSYQLAAKTDLARAAQRRGLTQLLEAMKARHPDAHLLLNRGFEVLPSVANLVHGVVAESLFDRWDARRKQYVRVPEADRAWLLAKLREVRDQYRLPVLVIDYRPEAERDAARETARRILKLGFEPWVCNGMLSDVGIGRYEVLPRRVLLLTDMPLKDGAPLERGPLSWLAPVLEYQGYFLELRSVHAGLPESVAGRYAGVISWLQGASLPSGYGAWLANQVEHGVHFALFGALGFELGSPEAGKLGLRPAAGVETLRPSTGAILQRDGLIGFEAEPPLHPVPGDGVRLEGGSVVSHLQVLDQDGQRAEALATTKWGGIALSHVFALRGLAGERAWVLDPFAFLARSLQLPAAPVPDVTTEYGRRLAVFLVDPNGLTERARLRGRPYTWAVLRDEVLARYPWPHGFAPGEGVERFSQLPAAHAATLRAGETDASARNATLTRVQGMTQIEADGLSIPAPIAWDSAFIPAGGEAYPYREVLETLQFTDAPRRLKPAALHYHAYLASSPGGLETLQKLYGSLEAQNVAPISSADYAARVHAFREQVLARDLDGSWSVHGGAALKTLRLPNELGELLPAADSSEVSVHVLPQGRYVTFQGEGPRRLTFRGFTGS